MIDVYTGNVVSDDQLDRERIEMAKKKKLCEICGENPATVPDRERMQPIETAPKDGTRLLLATPTGKVADGMWSTRYEVWSWPYVMAEPTHWMPAPPIPTIAHN